MHPIEAARTSTRACTSTSSTGPVGSGAGSGSRIVRTKARAKCRAASICPTAASASCSRGRKRRDNDAFNGGGMSFDVIEPFKRLTVRYRGKLCLMNNPKDMAGPGKAFKNNPVIPVDLTSTSKACRRCSAANRSMPTASKIEQKAEESFARGHYEQHTAARARSPWSVTRPSRSTAWACATTRGGRAIWQAIHWYRWLPMNFSRDFAMMVSITCKRRRKRRAKAAWCCATAST